MARRDGTVRPPLILAYLKAIIASMGHEPDDWIETRTGYVPREKSLGDVRIRRKDDMFRVSANLFGSPRDVFESDLDICLHLGNFLKGWIASEEAWRARSIAETRPCTKPGDVVTIRKYPDDTYAYISVTDPDGNDIAKLTFSHTSHRCCYAVGSLAIDGSPHVTKEFRGQGLSNYMHDLASEVAGLPFVPHGRNLCGGFLTLDGKAFWDARSLKRNVPGHNDPAVAGRTEQLLASEEIPDLERTFRLGSMHAQNLALALALVMPGYITGVVRQRNSHDIVDYTWFVPEDGEGVFSGGYKDADEQAAILAGYADEGDWTGGIDIEDFVAMVGFMTDKDTAAFDARAGSLVNSMRSCWGEIGKLVGRNHGIYVGTEMPADAVHKLQDIIERCKVRILGTEPAISPV